MYFTGRAQDALPARADCRPPAALRGAAIRRRENDAALDQLAALLTGLPLAQAEEAVEPLDTAEGVELEAGRLVHQDGAVGLLSALRGTGDDGDLLLSGVTHPHLGCQPAGQSRPARCCSRA